MYFEHSSIFQTYEEFAIESVAKVSQYFCKLHNILQYAEHNTLRQIKENVKKYKNEIELTELRGKKTIENLENMISSLQSMAKQSKQIHFKKIVDSSKKILNNVPAPVLLLKYNKNPFIIEEIDDLAKLLKELCPFKLSEENEKSNPVKISSLPVTNIQATNTLKNEFKNPLLSSILCANKKNFDMSSTKSQLYVQKARVSYFVDPKHFYIIFNSLAELEENLKIECATEGKINTTPNEIKVGEIHLIKNNQNIWQRGKIIEEPKPFTYFILLIDVGEIITSTKQQIKSISPELKSKDHLIKKCSIFAIEPKESKEWSDDAKMMCEDLILNKNLLIVVLKETAKSLIVDVISTEIYPVSLQSALLFTDSAKLINNKELLNDFKYYVYIKKKELVPIINRGFYPTAIEELTQFRIVPLNIMSPSEFYVAQFDSENEIKQFHSELNTFYKKNCIKVYCPRVNMRCAAKINGNWYRCRVIRVDEKLNVEIFLIDQGQSQTVHYSKLSYLDQRHSIINEYSFRCILIDIEPLQSNDFHWTSDALIEFKRIMKHSHLKVFIHTINNFDHKVTLTIEQKNHKINANALMVKYGHAISTGIESMNIEVLESKSLLKSPNKTAIRVEKNKSSKDSSNASINNDTNKLTIEEFITKPIPSTSSSNSLIIKPISQQVSANPEREEVIITHIVSPGEFYLRLQKYNEGITKLHNYIQKQQDIFLNDNAEYQMIHDWKLNQNCLCYVNIKEFYNKNWYRGAITKIEQINAEKEIQIKYAVFLRDHGLTIKNLTNKDLSPISVTDGRICDGAIKCHLACVGPTGGTNIWSSSSIDNFKMYINRYNKICASIQGKSIDNSIPTILWGISTEVQNALSPTTYKYFNINKTLNNNGYAELYEKFDRDKQLMKLTDATKTKQNELINLDSIMECIEEILNENTITLNSEANEFFFNEENLENEENFTNWSTMTIDKSLFAAYPTNVDNDCIIYLHDAEKANLLENIKIFINRKFINQNNNLENKTNWCIGQPCLARYHNDSFYYRAEIVEIMNNGMIKVCFVDYGNIEECKNDEIIEKVCLTKIPRQAVKYQLYGIEPNTPDGKWTTGCLDLIHILIVQKLCSINVINSNNMNTSIKKCLIKVNSIEISELLLEKNMVKRIKSSPKSVHKQNNKTDDKSNNFNKKISLHDDIHSSMEDNSVVIENNDDITDNNSKSEKYDTIVPKIKQNIEIELSSSDDETEILHLKQNKTNKSTEYVDIAYENMFQCEELNKFYSSVVQYESNSSDEIDNISPYKILNLDEKVDYYRRSIEMEKQDHIEIAKSENKTDSSFSIESLLDPVAASTPISPFEIDCFEYYKLPCGIKGFYSEVHFIENLTNFYISPIITDLQKQYFDLMQNIQPYVKNTNTNLIDFEIRTPCLALFSEDGLYYRGIIQQIDMDLKKAEILFVDYFNKEYVSFENIKKCPNKFIKYPLRLLPVQLFGVKPNPRWRQSDIKLLLEDKINRTKIFTKIMEPGIMPKVNFLVSQKNKKLILQDLYDKKIFLPN